MIEILKYHESNRMKQTRDSIESTSSVPRMPLPVGTIPHSTPEADKYFSNKPYPVKQYPPDLMLDKLHTQSISQQNRNTIRGGQSTNHVASILLDQEKTHKMNHIEHSSRNEDHETPRYSFLPVIRGANTM